MKKALRRSNRKGFYYKRGAIAGFSPLSLAPLAWWRFNEGSGVVALDSSGNGVNGSLENSPPYGVGPKDGALSFNGLSQYVATPFAGTYEALTFVSLLRVLTPGAYKYLVKQSDAGSGHHGMTLSNDGTKLGYFWNTGAFDFTGGPALPEDTWAFCAVAVGPDNANLYVNTGSGLQVGTDVLAHAPAVFTELDIAGDTAGDGRYTHGDFDDVLILEGQRSSDVIALLSQYYGFAP